MPIQQGEKIIATEINAQSGTSFAQAATIKADDLKNLYGGSDTIAFGALIKAEHFQNLGLPGSGGLNGHYTTSSKEYTFKEAIDANIISYTYNTSGWELAFPVGGTLNFSSFGKWGSAVDVFILGGGGAGIATNNSTGSIGAPGGGGYYNTLTNHSAAVKTNYTLTVGKGATTAGNSGGKSSAFGISVDGGDSAIAGKKVAETCICKHVDGGQAVIRYATGTNVSGWSYLSYNQGPVKLKYPREWKEITVSGVKNITTVVGAEGYYYYVSVGEVQSSHYSNSTTGSGASWTRIFGSGNTVSGVGPSDATAPARKGQGGGSTITAGNNGLIVIRNHRS